MKLQQRAGKARRGVWTVEYLMVAVAVLVAIIWAVTTFVGPAAKDRMDEAQKISNATKINMDQVIP